MQNDPSDSALKAFLERRNLERLVAGLKEADEQGWARFVPSNNFEAKVALLNAARNNSFGLGSEQADAALRRSVTRFQIVDAPSLRPDPRSVGIQRPPGTHLARCARFLLTKEAFRRYVYPVIADMQHEYCEALAAGEPLHARWIAVRGWLLVVPGWLVGVAGRVVKRIFSA